MSDLTPEQFETLAESLPASLQPVGAGLRHHPLNGGGLTGYGEVLMNALTPVVAQMLADERERIAQAIEADPGVRLGHNVSVVCSCLRCEVALAAARIAREAGARDE